MLCIMHWAKTAQRHICKTLILMLLQLVLLVVVLLNLQGSHSGGSQEKPQFGISHRGSSRGCWVSVCQEHSRDAQHWAGSGCGELRHILICVFAMHKTQSGFAALLPALLWMVTG